MRIAVGADHAGFELKGLLVPWLQSLGHDVVDRGAHKLDPSDDYPDFAAAVAEAVVSGNAERGSYRSENVHKNSSPGCASGALAHNCGGGYGP